MIATTFCAFLSTGCIRAMRRSVLAVGVTILLMALAACGGGGGGSSSSPAAAAGGPTTYTIGGSTTGLLASHALELIMSGTATGGLLAISANGPFTFNGSYATGKTYTVAVQIQPILQTCNVANASGTVAAANITDIAVTCATTTYTVGGTLSGLSGTLVLQNNGGDNLTLTADGTFTFATHVPTQSSFSVTVLSQPAAQSCNVSGGTGTVTQNITSIVVNCSNLPTYTIGGTITGLVGTVVLQDNGGDNLTRPSGGAFTFATPLLSGAAYAVTVLTQPGGEACLVTSGSGTVASANITGVTVTCTDNVAPTATSSPAAAATILAAPPQITVQYSEPVSAASLVASNYTLSGGGKGSLQVSQVASAGTNAVNVLFDGVGIGGPLNLNIANVADVAGNALATTSLSYTIATATAVTTKHFTPAAAVVAYGGGHFVAATGGGYVLTSSDGTTWSAPVATGSRANWTQAIYTGTKFVLLGKLPSGVNSIASSTDGSTWTVSGISGSGSGFTATNIAFGAGIYVAGRIGTGNDAATSTDLQTWTLITTGCNGVGPLVFGGGQFVTLASDGHPCTSADGSTWIRRAQALLPNSSMAYGNSTYIATIGNANTYYYSTDGITWTSSTGPGGCASPSVSFDGTQFVASNCLKTSTSLNGVTWVDSSANTFGVAVPIAPTGAGVYVGVTDVGNLVRATNALGSWTTTQSGQKFNGSFVKGASNYFAAGTTTATNNGSITGSNNSIYSSTDLATWPATALTWHSPNSTAPAAGTLAVGPSGTLDADQGNTVFLYSTDSGTTVHSTTALGVTSTTQAFSGAAYDATIGKVAFVGGQYARWSTDGLSFNTVFTAGAGLQSVASNGVQFAAVGGQGPTNIFRSTDGSSWVNAASPTNNFLWNVTYGASRFVAVGDSVILYSPDGTTWTQATGMPTPQLCTVSSNVTQHDLVSVASNGTGYVAVGNCGMVLQSSDGNTWTLGYAAGYSTSKFLNVIWDGTQYVLVGTEGLVLTLP